MKKKIKPKKSTKLFRNKIVIILLTAVAIIVAIFGYLYITKSEVTAPQSNEMTNEQSAPEQVFASYTASFQIIINGETRTFTDPRYHNKSADVYISPEGSRIVQITVTKPNITWGDLFKTLPMSVDTNCIVTGTNQTFCTNASRKLRFYINDVETPDALTTTIGPNSRLKIVY